MYAFNCILQAEMFFNEPALLEYTMATLKNLLSHNQFLNQPLLRSQVYAVHTQHLHVVKLCVCVQVLCTMATVLCAVDIKVCKGPVCDVKCCVYLL